MGALYSNAFKPFENGNGRKRFQVIYIEIIIEKPNHHPQDTSTNNICLLKLVKSAHPHLYGIKVANPDYMAKYVPDNSRLLVSGFGQTGFTEGKPVELKHALVPKVIWTDRKKDTSQFNFD